LQRKQVSHLARRQTITTFLTLNATAASQGTMPTSIPMAGSYPYPTGVMPMGQQMMGMPMATMPVATMPVGPPIYSFPMTNDQPLPKTATMGNTSGLKANIVQIAGCLDAQQGQELDISGLREFPFSH
jgi:hypothetical protein